MDMEITLLRPSIHPVSFRQWFYLAAFVFLALPGVFGLMFGDTLSRMYLVEIMGPGLEESLGFRGGSVVRRDESGAWESYAIGSVVPGGIFARAGIRPGDIPLGYVHGTQTGFLAHLNQARGSTVRLRFLATSKGGGDLGVREVLVAVPARDVRASQ